MMMQVSNVPWKRNLFILWIGNFFVMAGMNLIIPFLPLYIQDLGVHNMQHVERWAGVIFSGTPLMSALFAPLWGRLSDVYGRKVMLIRSGVGMSIVMVLMGFAQTPIHLLVLRMLMGTISGFIPNSNALQAVETPKEHAGRALGILQTGGVTGALIGPLMGGVLAEWLGIRNVFYFTGGILLIATLVVVFGVHESKKYEKFSFRRRQKAGAGAVNAEVATTKAPRKGLRDAIKAAPMIPSLFLVSFLIMASMQSIEPVVTVYVQSMNIKSHIETISGVVFAASGFGTIVAAPFLGRLGDRLGNHKVLMFCLLLISLLLIPQAFVNNAWEIMAMRFLQGMCVGGLLPSVNALLRKLTPTDATGVVYGFSAMSGSLGAVAGPNFGGFIASHYGIPTIFFFSSAFFFINMCWLALQVKRHPEISHPEV
ncbi:MAG: MFS transporter [Tumebacillaceae bacterium]